MDRTTPDRPISSALAAPLGPAVASRRRLEEPAAHPAALLPPFVRPGHTPLSLPVAAEAAPPPPAAPDGIAAALEALVSGEPEDDLGLVRGADWGLAGAEEELLVEVTDLLWEASSEAEEVEEAAPPTPPDTAEWVVPAAPAPPAAPPLDSLRADAAEQGSPAASVGGEREPAMEPEPEARPEESRVVPVEAAAPTSRAGAALADAMALQEGPALQEVAGRLERIALALREGRPIELFSSGSSDPLEVLIAGYALGYSEAIRRADQERRRDG